MSLQPGSLPGIGFVFVVFKADQCDFAVEILLAVMKGFMERLKSGYSSFRESYDFFVRILLDRSVQLDRKSFTCPVDNLRRSSLFSKLSTQLRASIDEIKR
jgi:hypothetical protein